MAGQTMAFKKPSTPVPKLVACPKKYISAPTKATKNTNADEPPLAFSLNCFGIIMLLVKSNVFTA